MFVRSNDNPSPPARSEIKIGDVVWIIEKENYGTNNFKQGVVQEILTSAARHPRGIKVRLTDGSVGRVQWKMVE
ncbi:MAG: YwbE family protein [Patescibacteria group bacterium]